MTSEGWDGGLPLSIRRATLDDRPRLVELAIAFRREFANARAVQPDPTQMGMVVDQCLEKGVVFVDEVDFDQAPVITGMLAVIFGEHWLTQEPTAFEAAWYVDLEFRRGPAGLRLLKAGEKVAAENGADVFQVGAPNESVANLLRKLGYAQREVTFGKELR